jgi:hypothetical protein
LHASGLVHRCQLHKQGTPVTLPRLFTQTAATAMSHHHTITPTHVTPNQQAAAAACITSSCTVHHTTTAIAKPHVCIALHAPLPHCCPSAPLLPAAGPLTLPLGTSRPTPAGSLLLWLPPEGPLPDPPDPTTPLPDLLLLLLRLNRPVIQPALPKLSLCRRAASRCCWGAGGCIGSRDATVKGVSAAAAAATAAASLSVRWLRERRTDRKAAGAALCCISECGGGVWCCAGHSYAARRWAVCIKVSHRRWIGWQRHDAWRAVLRHDTETRSGMQTLSMSPLIRLHCASP